MAQRWVTEEELFAMQNQYAGGGNVQQSNPLMEFFQQLPPELQQKIQTLPPEKQQEVLMQLLTKYNNSQQNVENNQQFEEGGEIEEIPVEAERNENLTVQDGQEPEVEGGYLEQQSHNPVTGQSTYEIPDNEYNNSHEQTGNGSDQTGVNMKLAEGDVINSNKTKIPVDFKIYGKNFKGKTFKDASDYLSKKETKVQEDFEERTKEGKTDKVSEGALQIMLTKLGKERNELNELQEQVLESKKQKETNEAVKSGLAEYGKIVLEVDKAEKGFNASLDRYLNYKVTKKPVLKAADGLNASIDKFSKFADGVSSNPKASLQDIMASYKASGLGSINPSDNTSIYKPTFNPINGSQIIGDFKAKIAQKETGGYRNPYIAVSGISEKEASSKSFKELQSKAASSAIGKYQFVWNIHKNDIARVTGVKDPDAFRHNPQAQEAFMDWFRDTQLLPQATEVKQKYQIPMSIEEIMAGIHLEGKGSKEKGNGFIGKYLSGQLKKSTMAGSFKNASTSDYMSGFEQGGYAKDGFNFTTWEGDKTTPGLNKADYTPDDLKFIAKTYFPNIDFKSNKELQEAIVPYLDENFGGYQNYVKPITPFADKKTPLPGALYDDKFGDDWSAAIKLLKENSPVSVPVPEFKFDPYITREVDDTPINNRDNLNRSKVRTPNNRIGAEKSNENSKEEQNKNKTSWMDKLKYGIRESLPYLRNLALMNEDTINPILQQKSYQNPYDNMNTDYSIQSALNDSDRSTLTAMADERGNPSVRSARLAQIAANAIAAKAPLYTQKYNQEQQLQNQKTIGQSQYLNQWEDVNRGLHKDFEHEVLQTREIQRQQKAMAIDNMMNDYLRKQEQNQAIDLSLLETNYDYNPITGKYEFNKEKAERNFAEKKYLAKNSSSSNNSKIIEGADGESYEVITPKSGKPIIRKIEKKYGGKVVKY